MPNNPLGKHTLCSRVPPSLPTAATLAQQVLLRSWQAPVAAPRPTVPCRVQPPRKAPRQLEQCRGACMGMEGGREDLREAFWWLLPGLLPAELAEGEHIPAKHFPGLQAKAVDRGERRLSSGGAPLKLPPFPQLLLCSNREVVLPHQDPHLRVISKKDPVSSASLPVSSSAWHSPLLCLLLWYLPCLPHLPLASQTHPTFIQLPPRILWQVWTAGSHAPPWS